MKCCKLFSCLLDYPTEALWQEKNEIIVAVNELAEFNDQQKSQLIDFITYYFSMPLLDAQEHYYQTFEMGNMTSLLLFEHVHGDSRDRGQAMVDLIDQYAKQGIEIAENQLPDYLPLFLEYLSILPKAECKKWLENIALILQLLKMRLEKKESLYTILFQLLYQLSEHQMNDEVLKAQVASEASDTTTEAIDKAWLETQVLFQGPIHANNKSINNSTYYVTVSDNQRSC